MVVNQQFSTLNRQILHVDMDSFFASVAQQDDPHLQGRPIVICGKPNTRTVVAAASREAKRRGIKTAMATWEAVRICPDVLLVPGNPQRYKEVHHLMRKILNRYTPEIETFSIDEWFLDVTQTAKRFGGVVKLSHQVKQDLKEAVGDVITCSVGIGPNKMLAKIASDLDKPNGVVNLLDCPNLQDLLAGLPLDDVCGIGPRVKRQLNNLAIFNLKQLAQCPLDVLTREFGVYGHQLHQWAKGEGSVTLTPFYNEPAEKSFGHSYTLPFNTLDYGYLRAILLRLSEKVTRRMRRKNFSGRTIHLWVRNQDFRHWSKQTTLSTYTNQGHVIYQEGWRTFLELGNEGKVRALGISVSNLSKTNQAPLLPEDQREHTLTHISDIINKKYGDFTIFRGTLLGNNLIPQTGFFAS